MVGVDLAIRGRVNIISLYIVMKNKIITFLILWIVPFTAKANVELDNPLGSTNNVSDLIVNMVNGLLGVTGALALFFVIQGGVTWITSGGNAEKVKAGKAAIQWALLGLIAIFLSYVVVHAVFITIEGAGN